MSVMIVSDHTDLAIAQGMASQGWIDGPDVHDMAELLRLLNEVSYRVRYRDSLTEEETRHYPITTDARAYTDEEVYQCCRCFLYQIEGIEPKTTGEPRDRMEALRTVLDGVGRLAEALKASHLKDGTWKTETYLGTEVLFVPDGTTWMDGTPSLADISSVVEWDLAA